MEAGWRLGNRRSPVFLGFDFGDFLDGGGDFLAGILFGFGAAGGLEVGGEGVVVGGGDGVEFVVVAAGAGDGEAEEGF